MKIRTGFVSNSSSSSFICEICGAGYEVGYSSYADEGVVSCENGHNICNNHLLCTKEEFNELVLQDEDVYYSFPEKFCPCCQGVEASKSDIVSYAKKHGLDKLVQETIKSKGYHYFKEHFK